jgi:hypothetical protein
MPYSLTLSEFFFLISDVPPVAGWLDKKEWLLPKAASFLRTEKDDLDSCPVSIRKASP